VTYLPAYLAVTAGLLAVFDAVFAALQWAATGRAPRPFRTLAARLEAARDRRRPAPEPMPPVLLGLELRRLGCEVQRIAASDLPAKAMRLQACTAAYDHVLLECCRTLDVPVSYTATPLSGDQRFDAEASLLEAGFSW
jgi:hypothetical protein